MLSPIHWLDIKLYPPTEEDALYAFMCWWKGKPMIGEVMTLKTAKQCREYDLTDKKFGWTHYIKLPHL